VFCHLAILINELTSYCRNDAASARTRPMDSGMFRSLTGSPIRGAMQHGLRLLIRRVRGHDKQRFLSIRRFIRAGATARRNVERPRGCVVTSTLFVAFITTCAPRAERSIAHAEPDCSRHGPVSLIEHKAQGLAAPFAPPHHVVVVAIDGVRWQEVFRGVDPSLTRAPSSTTTESMGATDTVPVLHQIACARGVLLGNDDSRVFVSSPTTVSLPGYSELFGGRTPTCAHNECPPTREPTLLDAWQQRDSTATLAVISSWAKIPRVAAMDRSNLLITAGRRSTQKLDPFRSDPVFDAALRSGRTAHAAPGIDDYRPDRYTAEVGLRLLELAQPSFLFLGLGDTDEYAHQGDYGAYLEALRFADSIVGRVERWLTEQQHQGKRTLLVVTTDHGRAASFRHHTNSKEAARIWMLWSGSSIRARGYPATGDIRLADLSPTVRQLMRLQADHDRRAGRALVDLLAIEASHWDPETNLSLDQFATLAPP
jgi:hypothetical protein